jgi:hypothetical protein
MGESAFSESMIKELLIQKEAEVRALYDAEEFLQKEILGIDAAKCARLELGKELENRSEIYERHGETQKRAMLMHLINRVDVYRDRLSITYNLTLDNFVAENNSENDSQKFDADGGESDNTEVIEANQPLFGKNGDMQSPCQAA